MKPTACNRQQVAVGVARFAGIRALALDRRVAEGVPGVRLPLVRNAPVRIDAGPQAARGILTSEPPRLGAVFRTLVPAVEADGNDRAGIRLPEIAVPLATQTGWNWRQPSAGVEERYLLPEDVPVVLERAAAHWDWRHR